MIRHLFLMTAVAWLAIRPSPIRSQPADLFGSEEELRFTVRGDLSTLFNDRGDQPVWHPVELAWPEKAATPIRAKVRGHFRKSMSNCGMPPLLLDLSNALPGYGSLKLVTPCSDDRYVVREYLVYQAYRLFTEKSFRVRLARVTFENSRKNGKQNTALCFLIEDEESVARRNALTVLDRDQVRPETTDRDTYLTMAIFELFAANTDWSVQYRQNIKLLTDGKTMFTVPYDFDHAGLVGAPYAKPAPELEMNSVRERRYRGFCIKDMNDYSQVIRKFHDRKEAIRSLYTGHPLLDEKYVTASLRFIEDFYAILENEKSKNAVLGYPCRSDGTGHVVIKGLRQR